MKLKILINIVKKYLKLSKFILEFRSLSLTQHRGREKTLLQKLNIPCAPFELVNSVSDLTRAINNIGLPAILKTTKMDMMVKVNF